MRLFVVAVLITLVCYCDARPRFDPKARASFIPGAHIIGGTDAAAGEFPWQLSQQRLSGTWYHSCGASLLSSTRALSAAHCVEGAAANILRVIAGIREQSSAGTNGIISDIASYVIHENYNDGTGTFANDIAILTLATAVDANGGTIQFASLPLDNVEQFTGRSCVMSGWGYTGYTDPDGNPIRPDIMQKASIGVISTTECNNLLSPVSGATATSMMICLYDSATQIGSCSGDSGGPLNCNYPQPTDTERVVAGVTSWGIQSGGECSQSYPSIYTRTSAYLEWINQHM